MYDGDWKDLIEFILDLIFYLIACLNKLVKTIVFWTIALLPLLIFCTLAFLNESSIFWFSIYIVLALIGEVIWAFLLIVSDGYR